MKSILTTILLGIAFQIHAQQAQETNSINSNEISIIEASPSGLVWIGLANGGCVRLDSKTGATGFFNKSNTVMKSDSIKAIDSRVIGGVLHVMMASDKGVVYQHGGVWDTVANLPDVKVTDISIGVGNRILFSTRDSGIAVFDTNFNFIKTLKKEVIGAMPTNRIRKMSRKNLKCNTIYAASEKGVIKIDSANNVTLLNTSVTGVLSDTVTCLYANPACDDKVYIGTEKGMTVCNGMTCTAFTKANGLSSEFITVIEKDSMGGTWIGTRDSGLIYYDNNTTFTKITTKDGLPSNKITDIHCVPNSCSCFIGTEDNGLTVVGCDKKVGSKLNISSIFDLINSKAVTAFPQPANEIINFKLSEQVNNLNFQMFDYAGKLVKSEKLNQVQEFSIEVLDLPQGFYSYVIKDNKGLYLGGKTAVVR